MATNRYGLWLVMSKPKQGSRAKPKVVALIESNEKGVEGWLSHNGHRLDLVSLTLLPGVEYYDPVDDIKGILTTGGIRATKTAKGKLKVPTTTGTCPGSGGKVFKSKIIQASYMSKATCPVCQKTFSVNGSSWSGYTLRKHKV